MEFKILGRKVEVGLDHVLLNLGALIIVVFAIFIISLLAMVLMTSDLDLMRLPFYQGLVIQFFLVIILPFFALILHKMAGYLNREMDVALCRSLAAVFFILSLAVLLLTMPASLLLGMQSSFQQSLLYSLASIAGFAVDSTLLYLWLLFFRSPDKERISYIAPYTFAYSLAMLPIGFIVLEALHSGSLATIVPALQGAASSFDLDLDVVYGLARYVLFALPILYMSMGKPLDRSLAYAFAGIYLAEALFYTLFYYSLIPSLWTDGGAMLIIRSASLALLFFLSRPSLSRANNV